MNASSNLQFYSVFFTSCLDVKSLQYVSEKSELKEHGLTLSFRVTPPLTSSLLCLLSSPRVTRPARDAEERFFDPVVRCDQE